MIQNYKENQMSSRISNRNHDYKFSDPPLRMKGFILHTLGGGTVDVYLAG